MTFGQPSHSQERASDTPEGKDVLRFGRYVRMYSKGDGDPIENSKGVSIVLSAFMVPRGQAILERSERAFRVALSNHADFAGTLAYVAATGAKQIITDNTRGPTALSLRRRFNPDLGSQRRRRVLS